MFRFLINAAAVIATMVAPLAVRAGCFDFSKRVAEPLTAPAPLNSGVGSGVKEASGSLNDGRVWASAQGVINHSAEDLLQDLLTHRPTRAGAAKEMTVKTVGDAKNDLQQTAEFKINPFPLVTVKWLEHWTYNALKGSLKDPEIVVVAYEKTEGTSHIKHLCGTLKLEKMSAAETRVTLYEEVRATRRTEKDTLNGVTGTLRELRDLKVAAAPEPASAATAGVKSGMTHSADE